MRAVLSAFPAIAVSFSLAATPAVASGPGQDCHQETSHREFAFLLDSGVVAGIRRLDGRPTILLEPSLWAALTPTEKLGMIAMFDCAIAGPGNHLLEIGVADPLGDPIAVWEAVGRRLRSAR